MFGSEHARLSPNTEVIVAPKERQQAGADSALGTDFYYEASTPLVVQVHSFWLASMLSMLG